MFVPCVQHSTDALGFLSKKRQVAWVYNDFPEDSNVQANTVMILPKIICRTKNQSKAQGNKLKRMWENCTVEPAWADAQPKKADVRVIRRSFHHKEVSCFSNGFAYNDEQKNAAKETTLAWKTFPDRGSDDWRRSGRRICVEMGLVCGNAPAIAEKRYM